MIVWWTSHGSLGHWWIITSHHFMWDVITKSWPNLDVGSANILVKKIIDIKWQIKTSAEEYNIHLFGFTYYEIVLKVRNTVCCYSFGCIYKNEIFMSKWVFTMRFIRWIYRGENNTGRSTTLISIMIFFIQQQLVFLHMMHVVQSGWKSLSKA